MVRSALVAAQYLEETRFLSQEALAEGTRRGQAQDLPRRIVKLRLVGVAFMATYLCWLSKLGLGRRSWLGRGKPRPYRR
jgi:hypothetical protein